MADQNQMHSEDKSGEAITDTKSLAAALQRVRGVAQRRYDRVKRSSN